VTAGPDGQPIGPAITWEDNRAQPQGDRLRSRCGPDELYRITGQWVDGRYLIPMFLRLVEAEPARAAATAWLLSAKDYLFAALTGQVATDPSTASGFGCYQLRAGRWDDDVLAAAGSLAAASRSRTTADRRDADVLAATTGLAGLAGLAGLPGLPPVLPCSATRPLRAATAARLGCGQIPVCLGAADSVLGALGLGVSAPGQIAYVAGTSTVILGVSNQLVLDPAHRFLVTPLHEPGSWGLEMDLLTTGSAMRWLAGLLGGGLDEAALVDLAAAIDPADAPIVLPYLSPGEQGALWDPLLHGAVAGLTLGHGRPNLARGLVNGIVLESRRCLAVLDETGPFGPELRVAGGSSAQASFRADLADSTGRRVVRTGGEDGSDSAMGAALLAARSVGQPMPAVHGGYRRVPTAGGAGQPVPASGAGDRPVLAGRDRGGAPDQVMHEPDPGRAVLWRDLWVKYEQARRAMTGYYHGAQ
jgi:xylulokinase